MNRAVWLIPPALVVGIASLAFVPVKRPPAAPAVIATPAPPKPPSPAPQPPARPVAAAVAPAPAPLQVEPSPANPESDLYANEIQYLNDISEINFNGAKEARALGGLDQAQAMLDEAGRNHKTVRCLENQQQRGVPFYDGKATCAAAVN